MGFGKKKVKKDVIKNSGNTKKSDSKSNSVHRGSNSINSSHSVPSNSIKQKKTYNFMKKTSNKNSILLFGMEKEEKLELFIKNMKIIHPRMSDFWLKKEIEKFKKKFNIE